LAVAFVFTGCLEPLGEAPDLPFSYSGPWAGIIRSYGSSGPTITGNAVAITGGSSTGFFINFADVGYTMNRADKLIFSYDIENTSPAGAMPCLSVKNPADWSGSPAGSGGAGWGVGKGWEYFICDTVASNYDGPVVKGTYNATTKKGTFEVSMALFPATLKAIGFQHNFWAEYPSGTKVGGDAGSPVPVYKITITKIEKIGGTGVALPEIDYAAFEAAVPLTPNPAVNPNGDGDPGNYKSHYTSPTNQTISWDSTGVIYRKPVPGLPGNDALFSIALPKHTEVLKDDDVIAITYHALKTNGNLALTMKQQGSGTDARQEIGTGASSYPGPYINGSTDGRKTVFSFVVKDTYVTIDKGDGTGTPTISDRHYPTAWITLYDNIYDNFAGTGNNRVADWKMKVTGVEILRLGKKPITGSRAISIPAPVAGAIPPAKIETAQYTINITWGGTLATKKIKVKDSAGAWTEASVFDYATIYTPTVTLTAKDGYVFNSDVINADLATNPYSINGTNATVTISASATTLSLGAGPGFPATGAAPASDRTVNVKNITGLTKPVAGATPAVAADICKDNTQYKAAVSWAPAAATNFDAETEYTATLTLTTYFGYIFDGVAQDSFTCPGAKPNGVTNAVGGGDTITVAVVFPATEDKVVTLPIAVPVAGAQAQRSFENAECSGTIRWFDSSTGVELFAGRSFASGKTYRAIVTDLTAKPGYTLVGLSAAPTVSGLTFASWATYFVGTAPNAVRKGRFTISNITP